MSSLDPSQMENLGLVRISPGVLGWTNELFRVPIVLLRVFSLLTWTLGIADPYAAHLRWIPSLLCFAPSEWLPTR